MPSTTRISRFTLPGRDGVPSVIAMSSPFQITVLPAHGRASLVIRTTARPESSAAVLVCAAARRSEASSSWPPESAPVVVSTPDPGLTTPNTRALAPAAVATPRPAAEAGAHRRRGTRRGSGRRGAASGSGTACSSRSVRTRRAASTASANPASPRGLARRRASMPSVLFMFVLQGVLVIRPRTHGPAHGVARPHRRPADPSPTEVGQLLEHGPEPFPGAVQAAARGHRQTAEDRRDLLGRETFPLGEQQHLPVTFGHAVQGRANERPLMSCVRLVGGDNRLGHQPFGECRTTPTRATLVGQNPPSRRIEPHSSVRALRDVLQTPPGREEDLRHRVLRVAARHRPPSAVSDDVRTVRLEELTEAQRSSEPAVLHGTTLSLHSSPQPCATQAHVRHRRQRLSPAADPAALRVPAVHWEEPWARCHRPPPATEASPSRSAWRYSPHQRSWSPAPPVPPSRNARGRRRPECRRSPRSTEPSHFGSYLWSRRAGQVPLLPNGAPYHVTPGSPATPPCRPPRRRATPRH